MRQFHDLELLCSLRCLFALACHLPYTTFHVANLLVIISFVIVFFSDTARKFCFKFLNLFVQVINPLLFRPHVTNERSGIRFLVPEALIGMKASSSHNAAIISTCCANFTHIVTLHRQAPCIHFLSIFSMFHSCLFFSFPSPPPPNKFTCILFICKTS